MCDPGLQLTFVLQSDETPMNTLGKAAPELADDRESYAVRRGGITLGHIAWHPRGATDELRELAHGVRPPLLDAGLGPALHDLANRAPVRVEVTATSERYPLDGEAAAYFVACEGLTNAIKHAHAGRILLQVARCDSTLVVSVIDDGMGGATGSPGSGLTGLSDRVAARGGNLRVDSARGRGTTLVAELPCVS